MKKKTIFIDFDGVLNTYTKWDGDDNLYQPKEGVEDFLKTLNKEYNLTIFSTRNPYKITKWLIQHKLDKYIENITNVKSPAYIYR